MQLPTFQHPDIRPTITISGYGLHERLVYRLDL